MSSQEGDDREDEPMLGFMFGNVDEDNQVDADYLDERALRHLAGLSKLQGGFALQAGIADEDMEAKDQQHAASSEAVHHAPNAKDFADETEEVEDISEPPANLTGIATALATTVGAAAEEEDYDFDDEPSHQQHTSIVDHQQRLPPPPPTSFLPAPQLLSAEEQENNAKSLGIDLPVLGKLDNGDVILAFTDLWTPLIETDTTLEGQQHAEGSTRRAFNPAPSLTAPPVHVPSEKDDDAFLSAGPRELLRDGFAVRKIAVGKDGGIESTIRVIEDGEDEDGHDGRGIGGEERVQHGDRNEKDVDDIDIDTNDNDIATTTTTTDKHTGRGGKLQKVDSTKQERKTVNKRGTTITTTIDAPQKHPSGSIIRDESATMTKMGSGVVVVRHKHAIPFPQLPECVFDPVIYKDWEESGAVKWHVDDTGTDGGDGGDSIMHDVMNNNNNGDGDSDNAMNIDEQQQVDTTTTNNNNNNDNDLPVWQTTNQDQNINTVDTVIDAGVFPEPPLLRTITSHHNNTAQADQVHNHAGDGDQALGMAAATTTTTDTTASTHTTVLPPEPLAAHTFEWESAVTFDTSPTALEKLKSIPIVYDLSDTNLILEQTNKHLQPPQQQQQPAVAAAAATTATTANQSLSKDIIAHSSAIILPPRPRSTIAARGIDNNADEALIELAKLDISKDKTYFAAARRRGSSRLGRQVHHAKAALQLETIPLPIITNFLQWHRPRSAFWPVGEQWKRGRTGGGGAISTLYPGVSIQLEKPIEAIVPGDVWKSKTLNRQNRKDVIFGTAHDKPLPLFVIPGDGTRPPRVVDGTLPLGQSNALTPSQKTINLVAVFTEAELYPTAKIEEPPFETTNMALLRPPAAFKFNKDLKAANRGRIILMEYLEESPMLLNRPGMGARLTTYYRRTDPKDGTLQQMLHAATKDDERWRVGGLAYLDENDESPLLGEIQPGHPRFAVETGLFTSIAHAYHSKPSDFLITRTTAGVMRIREITGTVLSGQELPLYRIPPPGSRDIKDLQERRIYVYVFKKLRQAMESKKEGQAQIPLDEVAQLFPGRPANMIRIFFKEHCGLKLISKGNAREVYALKEGVRLPSEAELRKKLTPEEACLLESTSAAVQRLKNKGIMKNQDFGFVAPEKLRLAAEMLPDDPEIQLAAKAVEHALQTAPWSLSDAFLSSFREGRATMRLHGPGDPTGRGVGYSFIRDVRHKNIGGTDNDPLRPGQPKGSKLQGTDADLRRMTTEQAKQKLMSFGLDEAEIEPLGRWVRIDLVRQLANAAAADGTSLGVNKYVRHQRTTLIELQKRYRERAQQVFEKQAKVVDDEADEDLGAHEGLEEELAGELEGADDEEEGEDVGGGGKRGRREGSPTIEEEMREMEAMRAAGLLGSSTADGNGNNTTTNNTNTTTGAGPSTSQHQQQQQQPSSTAIIDPSSGVDGPLIPGQTRRIRREIFQIDPDTKHFVKIKEIIYSGRVKPYMLASLYASADGTMTSPWNFGTRTINYKKMVDGKLGYAAARGRGHARGKGRGRGRGRGRRGSRGGRGGGGRGRGFDKYPAEVSTMPTQHRPQRERKKNVLVEAERDYMEDSDENYGYEDEGDEVHYNEEGEEIRYVYTQKKKAPKRKAIVEGVDGQQQPKPKPKPRPKPKPKIIDENIEFDPDAEQVHEEKPKQQLIALAKPDDMVGEKELDEYLGEDDEDVDDDRRHDDDFEVDEEEDEEDEFDPEMEARGRQSTRQRAVKGGGGGGRRASGRQSTRRGGTATAAVQAPVRASARSKKRKTYGDESDFEDEEFYEDDEYDDDEYKAKKTNKGNAAKKQKTGTGGRAAQAKFKSFNSIIVEIINTIQKEGIAYYKRTKQWSYWGAFAPSVTNKDYPDYYNFVQRGKEEGLENVRTKAKRNYYTSLEQFNADIDQIVENALAYHSHGKNSIPTMLTLAPGMRDYINGMIANRKSAIDAALAQSGGYDGGVGVVVGGYTHIDNNEDDDDLEFDPTKVY